MRLSERGPRRCFPPKRTISPRQKRLLLPFPSDRIPPGADDSCTVVPLRSTDPKPLIEHHGKRLVGGVSFIHPFPDSLRTTSLQFTSFISSMRFLVSLSILTVITLMIT